VLQLGQILIEPAQVKRISGNWGIYGLGWRSRNYRARWRSRNYRALGYSHGSLRRLGSGAALRRKLCIPGCLDAFGSCSASDVGKSDADAKNDGSQTICGNIQPDEVDLNILCFGPRENKKVDTLHDAIETHADNG